jgi:DNA mismatch repair protein MSH6
MGICLVIFAEDIRYAIAYAVLNYLVECLPCSVLFSTHYHKLTEEFETDKRVGLFHMSCFVSEEGDE